MQILPPSRSRGRSAGRSRADCQKERKVAFHDQKNTIVSPGVTALVKSRRACIQDVPETGWPPAELAGAHSDSLDTLLYARFDHSEPRVL